MVLSIAAKFGLAAAIPAAIALLGSGVFYAMDGSLEATVTELRCDGEPDPRDDDLTSWLQVTSTIADLDGWYQIPDNVCHTLAVGDIGRIYVQSKTAVLYGPDGACKWHSETGFNC